MALPGGLAAFALVASFLHGHAGTSSTEAGLLRGPLPLAAQRSRAVEVHVTSPSELADVWAGTVASCSSEPPANAGTFTVSTPAQDPQGCRSGPPAWPLGAAHDGPYVAVVRWGNCSCASQAQVAQRAGAKGLVVVGTGSSFSAVGGSETPGAVNIFVVSIQREAGDSILSWLEEHPGGEPVVVSFQSDKHPVFDAAEVLLVLFGTSLVATGALLSTSDLQANSAFAPQWGDRIIELDHKVAMGICFFGSAVLVIFYFFINYLIFLIMFGYSVVAVVALVEIGSLSLQQVAPSLRQQTLQVGRWPLRVADLLAFVPSAILGLCWLSLKDSPSGWWLQDIMGFGFICSVQRTIRAPNLKIAALLLSVMFGFDLFWDFLSPLLFGSSVLIDVITERSSGQTVPLLFRIPAFSDASDGERKLGFGDIAVPGWLVSYLRRHDVLSLRKLRSGYFLPALVGYCIGLCLAMMSRLVLSGAQPALLYLVPGSLGVTVAYAIHRGELSYLWHARPVLGAAEGLRDGLAMQTEITALKNDEGVCVRLGKEDGFKDRYYCGRWLGTEAIPDSDGQCGPDSGPQCPSCLRFQAWRGAAAAEARR